MEKALIMIREGDLAEAERTLVGVVEWADREGESNPLLLWLKDQSAKDLSFINAKARLGLALVSLKSDNLSPAKERLARVWEIPAVGRENGFMNIGLETIIYYMAICQNSSSNVEEAEVLLRTTAPWERIGNMSDLMKALELQRSQLEDPSFPLWKHLLQQIPQREYLSTDSSSQLKELTRWSKGSE
jgi:hypothetical protein